MQVGQARTWGHINRRPSSRSPRRLRFAWALALLCLTAAPAAAIDRLEDEEDIASLLPYQVPQAGSAQDRHTRPWAVLPQIGYAPDTSVLGGVKLTHYNVADMGVRVDLGATAALRGQLAATLSVGAANLLDSRMVLLFRLRMVQDPRREFFGLGNNEHEDDLSTHGIRDIGGTMTVGWRPLPRLSLNFQLGSRYADVYTGSEKDHRPEPNTTPERFPEMPGVHGNWVNPIALSIVWTTRDDVVRPTRGWRVLAKVLHTNKAISDFEFTRCLLDVGYLYGFNDGRQIIGARVDGEWIVAPSGSLPFWELSELGDDDTLRGFFPHRFAGKQRILGNLELRSALFDFDFFDLWHVDLDGVLFGGAGRVFLSSDDIRNEFGITEDNLARTVDRVQLSYGFGLRIQMAKALVARVDVGFSREAIGLVYLSFGHTF